MCLTIKPGLSFLASVVDSPRPSNVLRMGLGFFILQCLGSGLWQDFPNVFMLPQPPVFHTMRSWDLQVNRYFELSLHSGAATAPGAPVLPRYGDGLSPLSHPPAANARGQSPRSLAHAQPSAADNLGCLWLTDVSSRVPLLPSSCRWLSWTWRRCQECWGNLQLPVQPWSWALEEGLWERPVLWLGLLGIPISQLRVAMQRLLKFIPTSPYPHLRQNPVSLVCTPRMRVALGLFSPLKTLPFLGIKFLMGFFPHILSSLTGLERPRFRGLYILFGLSRASVSWETSSTPLTLYFLSFFLLSCFL